MPDRRCRGRTVRMAVHVHVYTMESKLRVQTSQEVTCIPFSIMHLTQLTISRRHCVTALDHLESSQTAFLKFGSSCIIHYSLIIYLGGVLS